MTEGISEFYERDQGLRALPKFLGDSRSACPRLSSSIDETTGSINVRTQEILGPIPPKRAERLQNGDPNHRFLQAYLDGVRRYPLLSRADEVSIGKRLKQKGEEVGRARDELIVSNLRLVVKLALRQAKEGIPLLDLIQAGNLGLMTAVERFDHTRGFRFSTSASWWIRASIGRHITEQEGSIRISSRQRGVLGAAHALEALTLTEKGRKPTEAEYEKLGVPMARVWELLLLGQPPISLQTPVRPGSDALVADLFPDPSVMSPEEIYMKEEGCMLVQKYLETSKLTPREKDVISLYFGIQGQEEVPFSVIAEKYNLTGERIRQILVAALKKIRRRMALDQPFSKINAPAVCSAPL